jgi:plastocyanin
MYPLHEGLLPLAISMIIVGLAIIVVATREVSEQPLVSPARQEPADMVRGGTSLRPEYSSSTETMLREQPSFSALASYTEGGFEPDVLTIPLDTTVRFANNASAPLWIASRGDEAVRMYPQLPDGCGPSGIDSCRGLQSQEAWQFTFTVPGTWRVVNALREGHSMVIVVQ